MRDFTPPHAKLVPKDAKLVFKGIIHEVYQWQQEMFDGSFQTFEMLKRPDTIKVIAIKDDKIVILYQEQPADDPFIDVPGGRHDEEHETELQAAQRELLEETGIRLKNWKLVRVIQPHTKIEQFTYTYVAWDFIDQTEQSLDVGEKIEVKLHTLEETKELLHDPRARYLPKEILEKVDSIQALIDFPEVTR